MFIYSTVSVYVLEITPTAYQPYADMIERKSLDLHQPKQIFLVADDFCCDIDLATKSWNIHCSPHTYFSMSNFTSVTQK